MEEEEEETEEGGRGGEREKEEKEDSRKWCYCNENKRVGKMIACHHFH